MPLAGRYEILGECGSGSHGVVYRARERATGRDVAIKVLRDQRDPFVLRRVRESLDREAQALQLVEHPGVVAIVEVSHTDEGACLVTEFVDGASLRDLLRERGRLEPEEAASLVSQAARALAAAHARGIVHRDVKPANLLVAEDGTLKITDFGVALGLGGSTRPEDQEYFCGTPAYVAPEQIEGKSVDARADIYSLGVVLYECLTGRRPFEARSVRETVHLALTTLPVAPCELVPLVPAALSDICVEALARDPSRRPASALLLARRLEAFSVNAPAVTGRVAGPRAALAVGETTLITPATRRRRRRPWAAALLGAAATALLVAMSAPGPAEAPAGAVAPEPGPAPAAAPSPAPAPAPAPASAPAPAPAPAPASAKVAAAVVPSVDPAPVNPSRSKPKVSQPALASARRKPPDEPPRATPAPAAIVTSPTPVVPALPVPVPDPPPAAVNANPQPVSARGVIEVAHPLARGTLEIRLDGRTVARLRLGDPASNPPGQPAVASFFTPPGERRIEVVVADEHRPLATWTWIGRWEAGEFQARRLALEGKSEGGWHLGAP